MCRLIWSYTAHIWHFSWPFEIGINILYHLYCSIETWHISIVRIDNIPLMLHIFFWLLERSMCGQVWQYLAQSTDQCGANKASWTICKVRTSSGQHFHLSTTNTRPSLVYSSHHYPKNVTIFRFLAFCRCVKPCQKGSSAISPKKLILLFFSRLLVVSSLPFWLYFVFRKRTF